jgi:hypothetical protein
VREDLSQVLELGGARALDLCFPGGGVLHCDAP